jgi:3-dehydroquinate synthase
LTTAESDQLSVEVALESRSYEIVITSQRLASCGPVINAWLLKTQPSDIGRLALVVTDRHVAEPHAAAVLQSLRSSGWTCRQATLEPGEPTKSLAAASGLYDQLVEMKADRHTCVIAVGGGVVGDLAGFVAATYARGIPFIQVPTTLLAQVDSSVGGKVGINHPHGKNLIGAFHQPLGVFIDTSVLNTLPERDYRSGLAEVVKYGVILDEPFFQYLEQQAAAVNRRDPAVLRQVVARSCRLKADVVEQDEFERTGVRAALNYGHTFAHAFEALCGYGELLHGEAVAIGMIYASRLAERRGLIPGEVTTRQTALLSALGLPIGLPPNVKLPVADILDRMRLDKKTVGGKLRFVLPTRLGHVEVIKDVPEADVLAVLESAE